MILTEHEQVIINNMRHPSIRTLTASKSYKDLSDEELTSLIGKIDDYVNEIGELIKPGYLSSHVPAVLKEHNMPPIRFHDLRHPYVKHTTKKYNSEKQKTQTTNLSADSLGFLFLLFILRLCP